MPIYFKLARKISFPRNLYRSGSVLSIVAINLDGAQRSPATVGVSLCPFSYDTVGDDQLHHPSPQCIRYRMRGNKIFLYQYFNSPFSRHSSTCCFDGWYCLLMNSSFSISSGICCSNRDLP